MVNVNGPNTGFIVTDRDMKHQFAYLLVSNITEINFKFPEGYCLLRQNDIQACVDAINTHIQAQFDWESNIHTTIDTINTPEEFQALSLIP